MYYKINSSLGSVIDEYSSETIVYVVSKKDRITLYFLGCLYLINGDLIISDDFNYKTFGNGDGLCCITSYIRDKKIKSIIDK